MNSVLTHLSVTAANALTASIWQGALIALAVALALRLLPGISAAARSLLWSAVFAVILLLHLTPFTHAFAPGGSASPESSATLYSATLYIDPRWSLALAALWLTLSLFRAAQLLISALRLRQIARRATPVGSATQQIVHRSFTLCTSPDVDRPSVAGFFTPRILLPPALYAALSPAELHHVLLHETEHLRRADDWTNLLQKAALVVFPLNPVLLWVERRLCLERELACDDRVLAETGAPKAYASCLTALAEHSLLRRGISLALGAFGRQSELSRRINRILRAPDRALEARTAAAITGVLLLGLAGGGYRLAHAPQLLSFSPVAPFAEARTTPSVSSARLPQASFQNATFHVPETQAAARLNLRMNLRTVAKATPRARKIAHSMRPVNRNFATSDVMQAQWHTITYSTPTRMVLTSSEVSQVHSTVVPAVLHVPAYAAVATPNGWLIIQL